MFSGTCSVPILRGKTAAYWKRVFSNLFLMTVGSIIYAAGLNAILVPHQFLSGGVIGVALIIHYLAPSLDTGLVYFILNIPLIVLGWFTVSRRFIWYTAFGMVVFSLATWLIHPTVAKIENPILAAIFGGIVCGVGCGITLRTQGSAGGLDILSIYLNRRFGWRIGTVTSSVSGLVLTVGAFCFSLEKALYSLIYVFTTGRVLDAVLTGFNQRKSVMIVSNCPEEIANQILKRLHRGVTFLNGFGGYTGKRKRVIFSIITMVELSKLKEMVFDIDPDAFVVVNDTLEVLGHKHGSLHDH